MYLAMIARTKTEKWIKSPWIQIFTTSHIIHPLWWLTSLHQYSPYAGYVLTKHTSNWDNYITEHWKLITTVLWKLSTPLNKIHEDDRHFSLQWPKLSPGKILKTDTHIPSTFLVGGYQNSQLVTGKFETSKGAQSSSYFTQHRESELISLYLVLYAHQDKGL